MSRQSWSDVAALIAELPTDVRLPGTRAEFLRLKPLVASEARLRRCLEWVLEGLGAVKDDALTEAEAEVAGRCLEDFGRCLPALTEATQVSHVRGLLRQARAACAAANEPAQNLVPILESLLEDWAEGLDPSAAQVLLQEEALIPGELAAIDPEGGVIEERELVRLAKQMIAEARWPQFAASVRWFTDRPAVQHDVDAELCALVGAGKLSHEHVDQTLVKYLQATNRGGWPQAEPFLTRCLQSPDAVLAVHAVLKHLAPPPSLEDLAHLERRFSLEARARLAAAKR